MHSDKKRCADTLSLSRQAEQNRAEERVSIDTKKGSKYNKSNEKRGGGIQLRKRKWKLRIAGGAVTLLGIYLMAVGYGETITLTIATVVLIFGIEAYKNVDTPFGSAWLAKFYTMRQKALVFGPDAKGEYLYFWLTKDGHVGYLGYSFIEGFIKKKLTTPVYPIHEDVAENLADHLSYHSDLMMFQSELKANLEHFVKTGTVQPFQKISASQIYTFTEDYRLTGQHFDLEDTDGNLVYEIDSTVPLKTFYIYDAMHTEIFRMTKELLHALPTYRFYLYGKPYGVLKKQFALVRDQFSMELPEGKLELREYAGSIGHNYSVKLNGTMIGAIVDNMDLTVGNIMFDNAFLIVYDAKYLPQLTALAVMAARELARDKDGGLSNRS